MKHTVRYALISTAAFLLAHGYAWAETETDPVAAHEAASDAAHAAIEGGAEAAHGAHEGGVGLPQFDPSSFPSQVFWLAIAFAIMYLVFSKKTLPDIGEVLKKREVHIRSTLEAAKRQKEAAENLQQDYERNLENARIDAQDAFATVEKAIKEKAEKESKAFQERAAERTERTEAEISKAKAAAMEDMQHLAAEIASQAAEKIIGVETDIDQAKTVVRSLKAKAA